MLTIAAITAISELITEALKNHRLRIESLPPAQREAWALREDDKAKRLEDFVDVFIEPIEKMLKELKAKNLPALKPIEEKK